MSTNTNRVHNPMKVIPGLFAIFFYLLSHIIVTPTIAAINQAVE